MKTGRESKAYLERKGREIDEKIRNCSHPPEKIVSLTLNKENRVCGLCGKVFSDEV